MKNKKYRQRILLTILCMLLAYCAFTLPPQPQSIAVKVSAEKTITTTHDNGSKFFEWLGLLFLALSVWIWRRELKLTGFGPFSGESLKQQTPEDFRKDGLEGALPSGVFRDVTEALSQMKEEEHEARKQRILDLLKTHHAVNINMVANELGVTAQTARAILFILVKEGKVRCDGYPRSSLYTLSSSPENLALDHIRSLIIAEHVVESERRYVRIKRIYEIDGVFEAGDSIYLAEIKFVRQVIGPSTLDQWLLKIPKIAKDISAVHKVGILALVVLDDGVISSVQKIVNRFTYDTEGIEIRILVLSMTELEKAQNKVISPER